MSPAGNANGTGGAARFNGPFGIAVDSSGTLYVADAYNCYIRQITPVGVVTGLAGNGDECGSSDGSGDTARFSNARGIAVDTTGVLYVADTNNHTIRRISAGVVSTLAGLAGVFGSSDGSGSAARFNRPGAVAVDSAGTIYVADTGNHTIRQITAAGVVTTLAGLAGSPGTADGTGSAARFRAPLGVAVDSTGVLYVADSNNHTIRRIAAGAVVTTLAGLAGTSGNTDGTGSAARFNGPGSVTVDGAGTVYVADTFNQRVRQVTAAGVVTTLAGSGTPGGTDGTGGAARFNNPGGVAADAAGTVYVADTTSDTIRRIDIGGVVTTIAGFVGSLGSADGLGRAARFAYPAGVATDASGSVYVADFVNHTIRKISPAAEVTTFAGLADAPGSADGAGADARFNRPRAVAVDSAGTVYVADGFNHTIRAITPAGVVSTLAGLAGSAGSSDGTGSAARFNVPFGIAVGSTGTVYVADTFNHTIRQIAPGGVVTTLAGLAGSSGSTDGTGSAARFNAPRGPAVDAAGTLFVADTLNNTIRQITPGGVVTTLAGMPGSSGSTDGTGSAARFAGPQGIAVDDSAGALNAAPLYVADTNNHTIRKIAPGAVVTTISGCPGCIGNQNRGVFNTPQGVAVDSRGSLFVADTRNNTIRTNTQRQMVLVADFGPSYGIWQRRGTAWSQVHTLSAEMIIRISSRNEPDALVIDFGPGVGLWVRFEGDDGDVSWFQLHGLSPTAGVGVDVDGDGEVDSGVINFEGLGVWLFDGETGQWSQLHGFDATHLAAANLDGAGGDELIVDFPGYGLWTYSNGVWTLLHPFSVSTMVSADLNGDGNQDLVVHFPSYGVWSYVNGVGWSLIHPSAAIRLAAGDLDRNGVTDLVIDFGPSLGVWTLRNGTTWALLHSLTAENITVGDLDVNGYDEVIIDFGVLGLWAYDDVGGWQQVHGFDPRLIVAGRF